MRNFHPIHAWQAAQTDVNPYFLYGSPPRSAVRDPHPTTVHRSQTVTTA